MDEHFASIKKDLVLTLENVLEDMDEDGVEDHLDDDIDGDGYSNEDELAYGSNPKILAPLLTSPFDLFSPGGSLAVSENLAMDTKVGMLVGLDSDVGAKFPTLLWMCWKKYLLIQTIGLFMPIYLPGRAMPAETEG